MVVVGMGEAVSVFWTVLVSEARERVGDDCWVGRIVVVANSVFVGMIELDAC